MMREQRIWDSIYAAAWAGLIIRHDDPRETLSNEQLAMIASDARSIADRGLQELADCSECGGEGSYACCGPGIGVYESDCPFCDGTGRKP